VAKSLLHCNISLRGSAMRKRHGTALYARKRVSTPVTSAQKLGAA
jgi:hypothetical protein